jgi:hypothetical protein
MWAAGHIWVDGHWEDELVVFLVEIVEVVLEVGRVSNRFEDMKSLQGFSAHLPDIFYVSRVLPSITVRH